MACGTQFRHLEFLDIQTFPMEFLSLALLATQLLLLAELET